MRLSREDMLRELELLPAWRVRVPAALPLTAEMTPIAQSHPRESDVAQASASPTAAPAASMPETALTEQMPAASSASAGEVAVEDRHRRGEDTAVDMPIVETAAVASMTMPEPPQSPTVPSEALESEAIGGVDAAVLQSRWVLYCPQADDAASQQLLHNILRAMSLPHDEVALQQTSLHHSQVQASYCLLFGLAAANLLLGARYQHVDEVRGQLLTQGNMTLVVTHHPHAMLQTPALKKEVWQDICLLLAHKNAAMA